MTLLQIFFLYFATAILGIGLIVITRRNLVHAALWMLLLFVHLAGLYLFLNAEFIAAIQIIVYAGAIMVMFLFVVLLLNVQQESTVKCFICSWQGRIFVPLLILLCAVMAVKNYAIEPSGKYSIEYISRQGHVKVLGAVLYNDYLYPFVITALILFIPMVAVVVLAIKERLKNKNGSA